MTVGYLHRTAREYLSKRKITLVLQERIASGFVPSISILRAIVLRLKFHDTQRFKHPSGRHRRSEVSKALSFARPAEKAAGAGQVTLLDVEKTLNISVIRRAIRMNLHLYVTAKVTANRIHSSDELDYDRDSELFLFQSVPFYRYWFVSAANVRDPERTSRF